MVRIKMRRAIFLLAALVSLCSSLLWAAEGIISSVPDPSGKFCHLKFPAVIEETLNWDRPVLKDPSDGDIVDFYGPCDYDPLGKEQIARQKYHLRRDRRTDMDN